MSKVLFGTVSIDRDVQMHNNQFQYAASFEDLLVPAGEYPIYAYEDDLEHRGGKTYLGWRNYIGFEGTCLRGNIGNKPGEHTSYHVMVYDYDLAECFLHGHDYPISGSTVMYTYKLLPKWQLEVRDFEYDGERLFGLKVVQK